MNSVTDKPNSAIDLNKESSNNNATQQFSSVSSDNNLCNNINENQGIKRQTSKDSCTNKKKRCFGKSDDKINLREERFSDDSTVEEEKEVYSLLVSNMPYQWSCEQISDYIQEHCVEVYALEQLEGGDPDSGQTIRLLFLNFEKCNQARKQLKLKGVEGRKLNVNFSVPDDSDSDADTEKDVLLVKRERKSSLATIWKPDLDIWGPDSSGMYGLKSEYLESLGITPPIDKWVHVSNFRCDKSELKEVLELAGHVVICTVISVSNKYAKVMYNHPLEAVQAVSMLNGQIFYGQVLKVSMYKCPNNEMILPKGLMNVGPGLGEQGKPLRDIVKQYERHLNGKSSSVNQSIFIDTRDNTTNKTSTPNSENRDSIMTINTDLNSNSLEKEIDSNKSHDTNNETNISQFVPSDQTGGNKETITRPVNNCTKQFQPHYPMVSAGSNSASTHSGGGNWASAITVTQPFSSNPITNPQRNTAYMSGPAGPRNVHPQFNVPELNPSQKSSIPRFSGPSAMNFPVNKPLTRFSGPTPRPSCTIPRPNGPQYNNLNPIRNSAVCAPYQGVRGPGPGPNVCQTGSNSWGNSGPSLNNPVCRPSISSNVPPTQMPIAEANRPICAPQQQYKGTTSSTVELSNLPLSTTFPLLSEKLAQVGQVLSLELTTTGCAVVRFASPAHAERCYQHFNKMCVMGNYIQVKFI
ncbi:unnamed protein product [Parnassius mnemosyne]|uniref:RRM domain-containing protein n=1 Tax=Parnassius mnemosyne TaxID=213953 RepID=A0AAV1KHD0_9NEOP